MAYGWLPLFWTNPRPARTSCLEPVCFLFLPGTEIQGKRYHNLKPHKAYTQRLKLSINESSSIPIETHLISPSLTAFPTTLHPLRLGSGPPRTRQPVILRRTLHTEIYETRQAAPQLHNLRRAHYSCLHNFNAPSL